MAQDLTKLPKQIVLDLVNETALVTITEAIVTFGLPVVDSGNKNTSLTLTAIDGSGYKNNRTIYYNRVALQTGLADVYLASAGSTPLAYSLGNATTIKDFLPELNAQLGVNIQPEDIVDGPLPEFEGEANEQHTVTLVANQNSLIYKDSLTFVIQSEDVDLAEVITTTELDGLTYTPPGQ